MKEIIIDALIDSALMIPFLLAIYIGIEYLEIRFGGKIRDKVQRVGKAGPALGSVFGVVPQCGFSVISAALYSKRLITMGTLLAVYLSTSDEAIPVILAQPEKIGVLLPLLAAKICIALIGGYSVDLVLSRSGKAAVEREVCASGTGSGDGSHNGAEHGADCHGHSHGHSHDHAQIPDAAEWGKALRQHPENEHIGCCGHSCTPKKNDIRQWIIHPVIHTIKVFGFIFIVTLFLNYIIFQVGEENLGKFFLGNSALQPFIAAIIGLIPNCAASVAVTEIYLRGGISFGSAVAGLSSGAGLGILVLFKENRNIRENLMITGLLFGISVAAGTILHIINL